MSGSAGGGAGVGVETGGVETGGVDTGGVDTGGLETGGVATFNLADLWEAVARAVPDRVAVISEDGRTTHRELDERASRLAGWLLRRGIGPGDRVGVMLRNVPEHLESYLACFKIRAVPVNVNFRCTAAELGYLVGDAPLSGLVADPEFLDVVTACRSDGGEPCGYLQNADSLIIMPLQAATQWDGLAHVMFEQQLYNGFSASYVSSSGAQRNCVTKAVDRIVGRGVLLDLPRVLGVPALEPGHAIGAEDLDRACAVQGVEIGRGDFFLVRTGAIAEVRARGSWGDYAGGDAPGLGIGSAKWLHDHEVAGVATDTWDVEARPPATPDVAQPVHILLLVHMGLWLGEIFDLEDLAEHTERTGCYEFFFAAQPLRITGGIGSPINPLAIF